jgi:lysophospholipase L1-like esterase
VDVSKKDYPAQTTVRLGSEYYTLNLGIAGQTLYEVVANAATALDPYVLADIDDFDYVVVMILAGTNDIALHQRTAEQTYAKMIELCNHLSALSPKVVPVPVTMLERFNFFAADIDSAGFAAARNTFNTNIRNEYATFAPTFWDAALLNIQLSVDQVHPTDVGAETMSIAAATFIPTAVGATGGGATEVPIEETDSRWEFLPEGAWQRSDEVNEASGKHIMYTFNPDGVARLTPTCNRVDFENHLAGSGGNVKVTLLDGTVLGTFSQNGSGPDRVRTQISSPSMANQKIVYTWGDTGRGSILYVDLAIAVGGTFV